MLDEIETETDLQQSEVVQNDSQKVIVGLMISTIVFYLLAENIVTFLPLYA